MAITLEPGQIKQVNVQLNPLAVEPATLLGTVSEVGTGIGVPGATVMISGTGGTYQATTGGNGQYQISGIEPGTYDGQVTHPDYETAYF